MRAAIRARADELGVEKDPATQQYIAEAAARAKAAVGNKNPGSSLDLSQISTGEEPKKSGGGGGGNALWDEDMPTMLYDPTEELTEEERKEVDQVGQMPILDQVLTELRASKWPDFGSALKQVGIVIMIVVVSAALIIGWDNTLRNFYTDLGFIPRKDEIPGQLQQGLELPEGFTNNMSDEDLSKLTKEMNEAGKSVVDSTVGSAIENL